MNIYNDPNYKKTKLEVLLEDNKKCRHCSAEHERPYTLHTAHLLHDHKYSDREHLGSLCPSCHAKYDRYRRWEVAKFKKQQPLFEINYNFTVGIYKKTNLNYDLIKGIHLVEEK